MTAPKRGSVGQSRSSLPATPILSTAILAAASAYLLVSMEWLFFVTKPSLFSPLGWTQRVAILFSSALPVALLAGITAAALAALSLGLGRLGKGSRSWLARGLLDTLVPAVLLSLTVFLLVENFTKTAFDWNVGSFTSPIRYVYAVGLVLAVLLFGRRLRRSAPSRAAFAGLVALLGTSFLAAATRYERHSEPALAAPAGDLPPVNILFFSSDGIEANRMSVYGAERRTTPFLESRVDEFLVSENHFTNAATTAGSNGALLTGKLPTTTGVTQAGDAFRGEHVHQHLPGVLRQFGYHNIEIGLRHNADAYDHNLRRGFHVANSRTLMVAPLPFAGWFAESFPSEQYFLGQTQERLRERVAHAFGVRDMQDTFAIVTGKWKRIPDEQRMRQLEAELARSPRPFFAQVHLMGTHGERFDPRQRRFSSGKRQERRWDVDFLDDTILDFDGHIARVMRFLEERGELESTILVINSDHGMKWATAERLPLLIRFPGGEPRGRLSHNTQRIDIAPTVLGYLGVEPPGWMEGDSLLGSGLDPLRPILSTGFLRRGPFLPWLSLVQCHNWSELNLDNGTLDETTVGGHTAPCSPSEMLTTEEARQYLLSRLGGSENLPAPLLLGERLEHLRRSADPDERQRVADAIAGGTSVRGLARRLDDEVSVARVHWDLWTRGTGNAGLVVQNHGEQPLTRRLVVESGRERPFPVGFHLEDGESRHDFSFDEPGGLEIELAPVAARSSRLFILWSDQAFTSGKRRALGVKLSLSLGERLERLRLKEDPDAWRLLARQMFEQELPTRPFGRNMLVLNLFWDSWTRGAQPAALAIRNNRSEPLTERLVFESGAGREFPVAVFVSDGETLQEVVLTEPGRQSLQLAPVAPKTTGLFLVWTDQPWTPGRGDSRRLGVKLSSE